jgi:hypothetical protein
MELTPARVDHTGFVAPSLFYWDVSGIFYNFAVFFRALKFTAMHIDGLRV